MICRLQVKSHLAKLYLEFLKDEFVILNVNYSNIKYIHINSKYPFILVRKLLFKFFNVAILEDVAPFIACKMHVR